MITDKGNMNEVVVNDDEIVCSLTNQIKKVSDKELCIQNMIEMLTEEYGFATEDIERDFKVVYEDTDEGRKKSRKVELAVFEAGRPHDSENLARIVVVAKDAKVKATDPKAGVEATLETILMFTPCEYGCWTNGEELVYVHSYDDDFDQSRIEMLSDFPGFGQTLEDLERQSERVQPRKPANTSLVKTFKRCHDYIYGNQGMIKNAFWELLHLIFCKIYDEKRRFMPSQDSYRRKFVVGIKEQNTPEGQHAAAQRIKDLFEEMKRSEIYKDVIDPNAQLYLPDAGIAYVASELAKYSFLDATVDVKGTAYETIVSKEFKDQGGQFFTPRNVIRCMVEMLDPDSDTRVLDPACGSAGFLVMVLDHVRHKMVKEMWPDLDSLHAEQMLNSAEINQRVKEYAERMLFGFDFDPDMKRAARMNMVMSGDGHSNIFNINSLEYPDGIMKDVKCVAPAVEKSIEHSKDANYPFAYSEGNAWGRFDMIFTNPPFGAKVNVAPAIAARYNGEGHICGTAPEVVFIEACYNFLKPGGRMAIVLPDGILGNPNHEDTRLWILKHFRLLASVDLPVETFLPQVGVQASLLFLQKKTAQEQLVPIESEGYDVFMAIVEKVGKDRRGEPVYQKDEDGADLLFDEVKQWITFNETGRELIRSRKERCKHIADDLPEVAAAYAKFKEEHR